MQISQLHQLLLIKGPTLARDEFISLIEDQLSKLDEQDANAMINSYVPSRVILTRQQYLHSYQQIHKLCEIFSGRTKTNCQFFYNSMVCVQKNRIYTRQVDGLLQMDVNSDFKDILGQQYYRKLINYGSNGLLFQKFDENIYKSYSFFQWIENKIDMNINEEGDGLYLQLLKYIWMQKYNESLQIIQKIKITYMNDEQIYSIQLGIKFMREIYDMIIQRQQLRQIFLNRKQFEIRYMDQQYRQLNNRISQIRQKILFNINYFDHLKNNIKNRYYYIICYFLSNRQDNYIKYIDQIIKIQQISITDRYLYAKKYYRIQDFQHYKNQLLDNYLHYYKLDYIILFGTRKQSQIILQNYIDQTNQIQKAAIISVYLKLFLEQSKIGVKDNKIAFYNRIIKSYQFLLINMDLGISKHKFDQKCITIQVQRKKKTMNKTFSFNCLNCKNGQSLLSITKRINSDLKQHQLKMKGYDFYSKDIRNQVMYCLDCMYLLPKCSVCLFPLTVYNGYAQQIKKNSATTNKIKNCGENLSNSIVWCPKCFHGGHFSHIIKWMRKNQKKCPVYSCKCKCEL